MLSKTIQTINLFIVKRMASVMFFNVFLCLKQSFDLFICFVIPSDIEYKVWKLKKNCKIGYDVIEVFDGWVDSAINAGVVL